MIRKYSHISNIKFSKMENQELGENNMICFDLVYISKEICLLVSGNVPSVNR